MQRRTFLAGTAALAGATFAATPLAFAQGKPETTKVAIAVGGKNLFYYLPLTIAERRNYFEASAARTALAFAFTVSMP